MEERDESKRRWREHGGMEGDAAGSSRSPVTVCIRTRMQGKSRTFLNGKKYKPLMSKKGKESLLPGKKRSPMSTWFTVPMIVTLAVLKWHNLHYKLDILFWNFTRLCSSTTGIGCLVWCFKHDFMQLLSRVGGRFSIGRAVCRAFRLAIVSSMMGHNFAHWQKKQH